MPRRSRRFPTTSGWVALAVIAAMALLAWADGWFRDEWDSWRVASARQEWLTGDRNVALDRLRPVVLHRADRLDWLLDFARKASDQQRYDEALEATEAARAQFASDGNATSQLAWEFVQIAAYALVASGKGDAAVDLCRPFAVDSAVAETADFRNGFAYIRALAGIELADAERDVERALESFGWAPYDVAHRLALSSLDAGKWAEANKWIDRAIGQFEPIHRSFLEDFETQIAILGAEGSLQTDEVRSEISRWRKQRESLNRRRALMHAHRAVIRDAIEDEVRAGADEDLVRELGYDDPQAMARLRFSDSNLLGYAAFLDTLAWVQFRSGDLAAAVVTIDRAVTVADHGWYEVEATAEEELQRVVRREDLIDRIVPAKRGIAALHQHRAEIYRAIGKADRAEVEERKIRELGFEPGPHLF